MQFALELHHPRIPCQIDSKPAPTPDLERNNAEAATDLRRHGVSFEHAAQAFRDPFAIEWIDSRHSYDEERIILLGLAAGTLLYVAYTERGDTIRIISARKATRHEQDHDERQNAP